MVLPASGNSISLDQIHVELGENSGTTVALGDADVRALASDTDGAIGMDQFFGLSSNAAWIWGMTVDSVSLKKLYGNGYKDASISASKTGDGVYLLGSRYGSTSTGNADSNGENAEMNIIKLNLDGSIAWNYRLDSPEDYIYGNTAITCVATSGADEIFVWWRGADDGDIDGTSNKRRLLKLNASGVEQAERKYSTPSSQSEFVATGPHSSKVHDDGTNIYWLGEIYGGGVAHAGAISTWWTKIRKSDGAWQDEFGTYDASGSEYGIGAIYVDGSGNTLFACRDPDANNRNHNFVKYNSSKQKVFEKYFSHSSGNHPYALIPYGTTFVSGDLILAHDHYCLSESGITNGDYLGILRASGSDGSVTWWKRAVASEATGFYGVDVEKDSSSNLYMVGHGIVDGDSRYSAWIGKFNSSGVKQWNFTLGYNDDSKNILGGGIVIDANDNIYIMITVGETGNPMRIFKIPSSGLGSANGGLTAGQHGIYKITNVDFSFTDAPSNVSADNADTRTPFTPSQISDASSTDITLATESGGSPITLVTPT